MYKLYARKILCFVSHSDQDSNSVIRNRVLLGLNVTKSSLFTHAADLDLNRQL